MKPGGTKVSVAIFNENLDKVLLKWNEAEPKKFPGHSFDKTEGWGMPGGVQEPKDGNEIQCGKREVYEETNLQVKIIEPSQLRLEEDKGTHLRVTLAARILGGEMREDCKWVSLNRPRPYKTYGGHWDKLLQMRELIEQLRLEKLWSEKSQG